MAKRSIDNHGQDNSDTRCPSAFCSCRTFSSTEERQLHFQQYRETIGLSIGSDCRRRCTTHSVSIKLAVSDDHPLSEELMISFTFLSSLQKSLPHALLET